MKSRSHNSLFEERFDYDACLRQRPEFLVIQREKAVQNGMVVEVSKFVPFSSTINKELCVLDFCVTNLIDAGVDMTPLVGFSRPTLSVCDNIQGLLND